MDEAKAREAQKNYQLDVKRVRAFQEMVRTDGWKFFTQLLDMKIMELTANLLTRPSENSRGEDFDRGQCFGLVYMKDLPSVTIAALGDMASEPADEENEK
jgi:hypothetical protein